MAITTLNRLRKLRLILTGVRKSWLRLTKGVVVDGSTSVSLSSRMLTGTRGGIDIGPDTLIAFKTLLYTHDPVSGEDKPIKIGRNCFIGGGCTITPGVTVGDGSIVGAGAIVLEDVPSGVIVGGNPARVIREGIEVGRFGRLKGADENTRRMYKP
ncbi:MAG: acyltransferase [Sphingobium sp.]|nr:acyltransferase [Sphingobium sp.]MCP5397840.1 acyltransferase [Sphingomonas sp.]